MRQQPGADPCQRVALISVTIGYMARTVWRPPVGWPEPPAGWAPPPGWQPDPSWPIPPADWQRWQRVPLSRAHKVWLGAGIALGVTVIGLIAAAEAYDAAVGCGSVDPTDPANYTSASIFNDTSRPVTISDCDGQYCEHEFSGRQVLSQRQLPVRGACHATGTRHDVMESRAR